MKRTWICLLLVLAMLFCAACSGDGDSSSDKKKDESQSTSDKVDKAEKLEAAANEMIASAGVEAVEVVIGEIEEGRYGASAKVTAQIPNYTELFTAAYAEKNPTKALANAIEDEEYTTVEYQGYAPVYYEGDEQIVETDALVKTFIEKELIKAINAVLESEAVEE